MSANAAANARKDISDEAPESGEVRAKLGLGVLPDLLGFHLRMANATFYRHFIEATAQLDLTQKQHAVLELVRKNGGASQVEIASELSTDRATMLQIVDRLESRGLLERRRLPHDRRRQALTLTPAGVALMADADRVIAAHEAEFASRFTPQELEAFVEGLRRIHGRG